MASHVRHPITRSAPGGAPVISARAPGGAPVISARAPGGAPVISARAPGGAPVISARAPGGAPVISARAPGGALRRQPFGLTQAARTLLRGASCAGLLCALLLSVLSGAAAQGASDKAAAEALFNRGLALMRDGKYQEACERLEQSQSIERGIGTMLYLAECYEKLGKTASAWALFREASSLAQAGGQAERAEAGKRRAEKLEKSLSRLTIQVPAVNKVTGLEIQDNGAAVHPSVWSYAAPVDPGMHRIQAKAPGYLSFTKDIKVDEAGSAELEVPLLTRDENAPVASAPSAQETARKASPSRGEAPSGRMSTQRLVGLSIAGAGALAVVVGGALGIRAIVKKGDAEDKGCVDSKCPDSGFDAHEKAHKASNASTGFWAAGGVLLVGGLVTYFIAPKYKHADVAVRLDRQTAALQVGGVF